MWLYLTKNTLQSHEKKKSHGWILRVKPKTQYLNIILKFCPKQNKLMRINSYVLCFCFYFIYIYIYIYIKNYVRSRCIDELILKKKKKRGVQMSYLKK